MKKILLSLVFLSLIYGINAQITWTKIIEDSIYDGTKLNLSGTAYNRSDNLIYSIANHWSHSMVIQIFDMNNDTVTTIPFTNEPNETREFTYDYTNERIIGMRSGRDNVYSISKNGGVWVLSGNGSQDNSHYGGRSFWNANNNSIGFFGGYGGYAVRNGIWENSGGGWSNPYPNNNICDPARRTSHQLILGDPNQNEVFIFSGQGSCTGSQYETSCSISDPWATDVGTWCWLKDLYQLDLDSYNFTNILPVNDSTVQMFGTLTYDFTDSTYYLIGGYVPPAIYDANFSNNTYFVPSLYKFRVGVDPGFVLLSTVGTPPPDVILSDLGAQQLFYDGINDRLVWIRKDGVWSIDLCVPVTGIDHVTQCSNYTWPLNGTTYTSSTNTPTVTLTNAAGCDSVVTLDLTVNYTNTGTDVQTACDTYDWIDGNTYTSSNNTATHTLTNAANCDSVIILDLTITNSTSGTDTQTACDSYLWIDGSTYTASNNSATHTLSNTAGCDSVVTLDLTINNVADISTSTIGTTIQANNTNATYVWLNCDQNFAVISGQTNQTYSPSINGNYAVQLTENGCIDTSACIAITSVGIIENSFQEDFKIYPNPTSGELAIEFNAIQELIQLKVMDVNGKLIELVSYQQANLIKYELNEPTGTYIIELNDEHHQRALIRIIKL